MPSERNDEVVQVMQVLEINRAGNDTVSVFFVLDGVFFLVDSESFCFATSEVVSLFPTCCFLGDKILVVAVVKLVTLLMPKQVSRGLVGRFLRSSFFSSGSALGTK